MLAEAISGLIPFGGEPRQLAVQNTASAVKTIAGSQNHCLEEIATAAGIRHSKNVCGI
jgi:hypothetical protein